MKKIILLLTIGVALTTQTLLAQVPSYVPSNGLVGYWPFNGNANDQSGNGNNGTVNGASLTTDRFGNNNNAYSFNGISNYIQTNYLGVLGNNFRTISFWAKSNSSSEMAAFSYGASSGTGNRFDGYFNFNGIGCTANIAGGAVTYSTPNQVNDNNWHNYTYVVDQLNSQANSIKIYQDGILLTNIINNYNPNTAINTANEIGLRFGKTTYPGIPSNFNGKIDDICFWNRALSQEEITNMYNGVTYSDTCNAVSGSLVNGLVSYYPFCGNANDQSGNGNNGVVNGATLTTDRFGNTNSAYNFDGLSNYIDLNKQLPNTFSISLWASVSSFKTYIAPGNNIIGSKIISTYNNNFEFSGFECETNGNQNLYGQHSAAFWNPNPISIIGVTSISNLVVNQWKNIIMTFDGSILKYFVNGALESSSNAVFTQNNRKLFIGAREFHINGPDFFFHGKLDDIGIWNRALTQTEITQLYNQNQCITNITVTDTLIINVGQLSYTNPVAYANNITIYPNPASTQININFNNITNLVGGSVKVINALGQQVATTPITTTGTNSTMLLSTWGGNGLYFVQILNPQGQIVDIKKILLQ